MHWSVQAVICGQITVVVSQEWGIAEEYASSLKHKDEFLMATWQGLKVVAAVSKAIGISNKATEGFDAVIGGRNQQMQLQKAPPLDFINIKI